MTRKMMLIAGAATMALSVPAAAVSNGDSGQKMERQQDRGGKAKAQRSGGREARSGGGQRAERSVQRSTQRAERRAERPTRVERQRPTRSVERTRPARVERQVQRAERPARIERQERQQVRRVERPSRIERQAQRAERPTRVERQVQRAERPMRIERQAQRVERRDFDRVADRRAALIDRRYDGRPDVRRLPAASDFGQAVAARAHLRNELRKEAKRDWKIGQRVDRDWADRTNWMPLRYSSRYYDTPDWTYRYDGDRLYRVSRSDGLIGGIIPLLGGAYSVGQPLPGYYSSSYVPLGYRSMYYDTPDYYYRYGDGGLYRVNSDTGLITSLVALLTGTNLGIGSMLPASYNTYNVPYAYRSRYYDTDDAWYRYNNGYIYQVDPYSRMIEASYPMYGNGYYGVGQPWPVAYPSYNVPYPYQSTYYDTPQWDYRYANGAIYQVDPQTQLISALVSLVTGQPLTTGQMLPSGYGVYNVPMQYRSQYYDTADNWYRYGDGNIYQVDPYTGRIADVIPVYA